MKKHTLGIDIGSTTVKIAILDENDTLVFSDYERHFANIQETLADLSRPERVIGHTGTETRPRLLREAAVGNLRQWGQP